MNPEIVFVEFVDDSFQLCDRFPRIFAGLHEYDHVGGFAILRDEKSAPERTRQRVLKTLRPCG